MDDNINMDKQIREKLEGFSVAPPPHIWNGIQGQMAEQQKKRRIAYIGWISAAAVIVFAFIAGWFLNEQTSNVLPAMAKHKVIESQTHKNSIEEQVNIASENEGSIFVAETTEATELSKADNQIKNKNTGVTFTKQSIGNELIIEDSFVARVEQMSSELLESLEAVLIIREDDIFLAKRTGNKVPEKQIIEIGITENDELLMAANAKNYQKQKTNENGWIVGAYVSPGYSSHAANHDEQYSQNMTYSADNGVGNVGGGMSVQYKTGKRLRVESGVYYSQNGQSSQNSFDGLFSFGGSADEVMYASPENITNDDVNTGFSNTVQLSKDGIAMNSTAGVIKMSTTPKGAEVATNAENIDARYANTLTTNGEFSQVFEFVEVPLYLRYSLLDKKFGIELMGGINAGFVVGNNAYIDNDYGKQNIGSTEDISTLNISGTVGVGANYMLGKHLSLAFEPRFNYYLNSINNNTDIDYRPYRVGFFTGIYYEF